ncbi:hypothetical protein AX16_001840 [Volvariella volvacea WC 439]|nr:hypothetical protein AX16_001840 [Volvariella volvacea WC 439]
MARLSLALSSLLALLPIVTAQAGPWEQCGGQGWTGPTTCVSGWVCTSQNQWYSQCLQGSATTTTTTTRTTTTTGPTPTGTGLHARAVSKGKKYFGSETETDVLNDAPYVAILRTEFGQITAGNSMKWDATEPQRGSFQFSRGDTIVNFAKSNGQLVRGHTCVWHSQVPRWVTEGNFNNATLQEIIRSHTTAVVVPTILIGLALTTRIICIQDSWDVVNEPFNGDGTLRQSLFYNTIGRSYIDVALRAARAADPSTKLYINDYNIDGLSSKSTGMVNLIKDLKARGVPVDGVGIQAHLIVGAVPSTFRQNLEQFAALGVEVAITELDIRMPLPATTAKLDQQRKDYQAVAAACRAVPACVGITTWDFTDKYSWVPGVFPGQGAALPWDGNLVKKPAYTGIVDAFS